MLSAVLAWSLMTSPKTIRPALLSLGLLCCSTLFALAIAEASAAVILYSKVGIVLLPPKWPRAQRHIYANWTRHVVQFDPACTQFDTQLLYTLRPGECRFHNPEFDTIIKVNSAGF